MDDVKPVSSFFSLALLIRKEKHPQIHDIGPRGNRKGRSFEEAFGEVEKYAGAQFDPQLVEVALSIPRADWLEAKRNTLRRLRPPTIH
jgi:hypothetical protein